MKCFTVRRSIEGSQTTSLQRSSILSSAGICEPSLASLLFCDEFELTPLLVDGISIRILSSTCSHTFRHWINSLAIRRSFKRRHKNWESLKQDSLTFFIRSCLIIWGWGRRKNGILIKRGMFLSMTTSATQDGTASCKSALSVSPAASRTNNLQPVRPPTSLEFKYY